MRRTALFLLTLSFASMTIASVDAKAAKKAVPVAKPSVICAIKGNISATHEKIYHVKGCPNYTQTVITPSAGERMFCTEAEAKAAGWRKALNCPQ
jgi:hypothetical protein